MNRPTVRSECENGPRPCPWVGCKYHLYLDVQKNGNITSRWPGFVNSLCDPPKEFKNDEFPRRITVKRNPFSGKIIYCEQAEDIHMANLMYMPETCALDVASRAPITLSEVGKILNVSRERVRQVEFSALKKAKRIAKNNNIDPSDFPILEGSNFSESPLWATGRKNGHNELRKCLDRAITRHKIHRPNPRENWFPRVVDEDVERRR